MRSMTTKLDKKNVSWKISEGDDEMAIPNSRHSNHDRIISSHFPKYSLFPAPPFPVQGFKDNPSMMNLVFDKS